MPDGARHSRSAPPGGRPRLAIVSTFDELCGIAGYTRALEQQLATVFDVTVFDLDQYVLRSPHRRVQRMGDAHIGDIAAQLRRFDSVNIQLEFGTLGRFPSTILRRLRRLAEAAPRLSVTFHTVHGGEAVPWEEIGRHLRHARFGAVGQAASDYLRARMLGGRVYAMLRRLQASKPVDIIVHTRRDMRLLRDVYGLRHVSHHPLSFMPADRARAVRASAQRADFPNLAALPAEAKLIGAFGFLSPYKGFETAIRALRLLPPDHHLLIFGGVHPQTIRRNQPIAPYVEALLDEGHVGHALIDEFRGSASTRLAAASAAELLGPHPRDLGARIHFLGVLADAEFAAAMAVCDATVFPYLEVGQSSSGAISLACDMGCRVLASRTHAFLQFARYHPDRIEFFDIGNHAELAERLLAPPAPRPPGPPRFDTTSNTALYVAANAAPGEARAVTEQPAEP